MSVDTAIARFRTLLDGVTSATATVARGGAAGTFDEGTLTYVPGAGSTVYSGPCLPRPAGMVGGPGSGEQGAVLEYSYVVKFPASADIARGDSVTFTESDHDPDLVGVSLWVADVQVDEWKVGQVAKCSDQRPEVLP